MQFDTYHVFTVDEHTIEAIGVLEHLSRGELSEIAPVASELIGQVQSRRALYMAALLHDIAKGRGGDHSELGARIAQEVCPRLGMTPGGDRDGLLAGAAPPARQPDRLQARHRGSEDHPRHRRPRAVARAPAAAAGADGGRHARRRAEGVERLEGDPAARGVLAGGGGAGRRAFGAGARRAGGARAGRRRRRCSRPGRRRTGSTSSASAIPATGSPSTPRPMPATRR